MKLNKLSRQENASFHAKSYSENSSLKVFLRTLSYHKVGANFIAKVIATRKLPRDWRLLDVGCGDGQFTMTLFRALQKVHSQPSMTIGIDPDRDNLRDYQERLTNYALPLTVLSVGVEELPPAKWDVVVASHSLYHVLESPNLSEKARLRVLTQITPHSQAGYLTIASLASAGSPAYRFKRLLLASMRRPDLSQFGEHLEYLFARIHTKLEFSIVDSYMDVSEILESPSLLSAWTQYFCRLTVNETDAIGFKENRRILESVAVKFSKLPIETQTEYRRFPALLGPPKRSSWILPHRECFLVLSR